MAGLNVEQLAQESNAAYNDTPQFPGPDVTDPIEHTPNGPVPKTPTGYRKVPVVVVLDGAEYIVTGVAYDPARAETVVTVEKA